MEDRTVKVGEDTARNYYLAFQRAQSAAVDDLQEEVSKFNEHFFDDAPKGASLGEPLPPSNKGYQMLMKLGWNKNKGLGKKEEGRLEPIPIVSRDHRLGLGKSDEYDEANAVAASQRKALEVEIEETEEIKKKREEKAQKEETIQTTVQEMTKAFYCQLCNKQYKTVQEMNVHLDSYDHNHKKRFMEMKAIGKESNKADRLKKEQKRLAKEQKKLQEQATAAAALAASKATPTPVQPRSASGAPLAPHGSTSFSMGSIGSTSQKSGVGGVKRMAFGGFGLKTAVPKKKAKLPAPSIFGECDDDDDAEEQGKS